MGSCYLAGVALPLSISSPLLPSWNWIWNRREKRIGLRNYGAAFFPHREKEEENEGKGREWGIEVVGQRGLCFFLTLTIIIHPVTHSLTLLLLPT